MIIADQIVGSFRIFTHLFTESQDTNFIAGVHDHHITALEFNGEKFIEHAEFAKIPVPQNETVVNMISQRFSSKEFEVLVTTVNQKNTYENYLLDLTDESNSLVFLFSSTSTPILIADPLDSSPLVVYGTEGKGVSVVVASIVEDAVSKKAKAEIKFINDGILLRGIHTSSFLDLYRNMYAVLALHHKGPGNNKVVIYDISDDYKLVEVEAYELPAEIGPIVFTELIDSVGTDMIYVSKENNNYYLNIHRNISISDKEKEELTSYGYFMDFFAKNHESHKAFAKEPMKLNLNDVLGKDSEVMLNHSKEKIPSGIFLSDITGIGKKNISLIVKNSSGTGYRLKTLDFEVANQVPKLKISKNNLLNSDTKYIENISLTEMDASGAESLLFNTSDGNLMAHKIDFNNDSKVSLNLLVVKPWKTSGLNYYIPGATFYIVYENNTKSVKVSQGPQTSYPSLQRHKYVNLSRTNSFLNFVAIKAPSKSKDEGQHTNFYNAVSFIVPNTFSIFMYDGEKWTIKSYFFQLYYTPTILGVLFLLASFLVAYVFVRLFYERKKGKTVVGSSSRIVFQAL